MPLYGRERDFTTATLDDIRSNLKGDSSLYTDLSRWWNTYGEAFDFVDPTADIRYLENYMSEVRYFMIESAPRALDTIETNIRQLDADYAAKTDEIKGELTTYISAVDTLIEAIQNPNFATNFDRAATLDQIRLVAPQIVANNTTRTAFIDNLMEQYGFDEKTSRTIWKLWLAVNEYYADELVENGQYEIYPDWAFNKLLGSFVYGEDGILDSFQWKIIAGPDLHYPIGYPSERQLFIDLLGLTEDEYLSLRTNVRMQYIASGMDHYVDFDELIGDNKKGGGSYALFVENMTFLHGRELSASELEAEWEKYMGQFFGKTDFAHQSISTATWLAEDIWPVNAVGEIATGGRRGEMASWLGDATLPPYKFGNDDFKSDLDACNIYRLMKDKNISYVEAQRLYYEELNSVNGRGRTEIFLEHTPLATVEMDILNRLTNLTPQQQVACQQSEEGRRIMIEERIAGNDDLTDTYRFLQSLWLGADDMVP